MPTILYLLCIRMEIPTEMSFHEYNEQKGKMLRFRVGDWVEARLGLSEDSYFKGKVVKLWDMGFPYRIRIELTGEEVRAPEDHDRYPVQKYRTRTNRSHARQVSSFFLSFCSCLGLASKVQGPKQSLWSTPNHFLFLILKQLLP